MSRNVFGWDLPPGCTQRHIDEAFGSGPDPSELQEAVLALLEKGKMPQATCDLIMEAIQEAELAMSEPDPDDAYEAARDARNDANADRIDGYDRDDLGESPDY